MKPVILSIDGNIGSGKSTLYNNLKEYYKNRNDICFVPEPVDSWNSIVDCNNTPILTNLYQDTKKYAFRFQMMAYISRLHLLRNVIKENKYTIIISERCVHTDKNVFAKMLYNDGNIEHDEFQIYNQWFDEFLDDIKISGIIYVRASPNTCDERVKIRARAGETIPLSYLQQCHDYHEQWLNNINNKLIIDAEVNINNNKNITDEWINTIDSWIKSNFDVNNNNKVMCDDVKNDNTNKCPGCHPILQNNQIAHMGPNGCLGDNEYVSDLVKQCF